MRWLINENIDGIKFKVKRYYLGREEAEYEYHFTSYSDILDYLSFKVPAQNKKEAIEKVEDKIKILNFNLSKEDEKKAFEGK